MRILTLALCAAAVLASACSRAEANDDDGQPGPVYTRNPADTLRYHSVVQSTESTMGMDDVRKYDARLSVVMGPDGKARAWYDDLYLESRSEGGPGMIPGTEDIVGQPFALEIGERGQVRTLEVPQDTTGYLRMLSGFDFQRQFHGFFVALPRRPLRDGLEWADTARLGGPDGSGGRDQEVRITEYRVRGDSTVAGLAVKVIETRTTIALDAGGGVPGTLRVKGEGEETGEAYFAPKEGVFAGRTETGEVSTTSEQGGFRLTTTTRYSRTVTYLP